MLPKLKGKKNPNGGYSTAIYDTLLELYLQDDDNDIYSSTRKAKHEKAKQLLSKEEKNNDIHYDKNHALLVCQMYGFNEGTICLYEQLNLPNQVAQIYIEQNDNANLIKCCTKYGKTHPRLWVSALMYFADKPAPEVSEYIKLVLENIALTDQLAPIEVVEILRNSSDPKKHSVDIVKIFLETQLKKVKDAVTKEYTIIRETITKSAELKRQIECYQREAYKFTSGIEPPMKHYLGSSKSSGDENEELLEKQKEMVDLEERIKALRSIDYPKFLGELDKKSDDGFETIAQFLQKRVFDRTEQAESTFDPDLFLDLGLVSLDKI